MGRDNLYEIKTPQTHLTTAAAAFFVKNEKGCDNSYEIKTPIYKFIKIS